MKFGMMKRILLFAFAMLPLVAGAQDVKQLKKQAKAAEKAMQDSIARAAKQIENQ